MSKFETKVEVWDNVFSVGSQNDKRYSGGLSLKGCEERKVDSELVEESADET